METTETPATVTPTRYTAGNTDVSTASSDRMPFVKVRVDFFEGDSLTPGAYMEITPDQAMELAHRLMQGAIDAYKVNGK